MRLVPTEREARVLLNAAVEPGSPDVLAEVRSRGPVPVLEDLLGGRHRRSAALLPRLAGMEAERELERAHRLGIRFVIPGDDDWPAAVDDLAHGPVLHERGGAPLGLWVRGAASLARLVTAAVAIVGSRSATTYGATVASEIAAGVAVDGAGAPDFTVVSGAAFGIDQAAHCGALAVGAPTVAVLACGADRVYPGAHRALIDRIADDGAIVSEAPLGAAPMRIRFLARNRLIAALGQGTVVVEAAIRSGALNTAGWSDGLSRIVMGVPGPVTSAPSQGVHELIRARGALLVTRADDVREAIGPAGQWTLPLVREPVAVRDRLPAEVSQILEAVPRVRPVTATRIARTAGIGQPAAERALAVLERLGLVEEFEGAWRQPDDPATPHDLSEVR